MKNWVFLCYKSSLILTFLSAGSVLVGKVIPQLTTSVQLSWNHLLIIIYLSLICVQTISTYFTGYLNPEQKIIRSLILAITFALPWFLLYANPS
jgi:hypothetical protein